MTIIAIIISSSASSSSSSLLFNDDSICLFETGPNYAYPQFGHQTFLLRQAGSANHVAWMSTLPKDLLDAPLSGIAIPGSHDSASYSLDLAGGLAPGIPNKVCQFLTVILCSLLSFFPLLLTNFLSNCHLIFLLA